MRVVVENSLNTEWLAGPVTDFLTTDPSNYLYSAY